MKIGILGTRGIPNHHGGFEQFAEFFAVFLAEQGHETYVYNSSLHPYKKTEYKGVHIIHCTDPEDKLGTVGQFIYDLNCIKDSKKRNFDILLQLGYTSNSIWHRRLPNNAIIITNMDGLEWKRSKYKKPVRRFLKYAEKLAVKSSDYLIADSKGIQNYLQKKYKETSTYIPYGAVPFKLPEPEILDTFNLTPFKYNMLIARMEPENNIEVILDGIVHSDNNDPFIVVGKQDATKFGRYLVNKFKGNEQIRFVGGIYNLEDLNNLRYYSNLYFHGHSVGGTNPSLLEAMASQTLIIAHKNEFNSAILGRDALYFSSENDIVSILNQKKEKNHYENFVTNNMDKVEKLYSWSAINNAYLNFFKEVYGKT